MGTVHDADQLAQQFEAHRGHLRGVAYRMLGSLSDADDAVQEAWLRLSRSDAGSVVNLGGWLTAVVARVCLDLLRSRRTRREEPLQAVLPEPVVTVGDGPEPEREAVLTDEVGLALLVVLGTLAPAERLAFVLHDVFAVPYEEIAPIVGRTTAAARQLASRARRRVRAAAVPDPDLAAQRRVVAAFLAAARGGDLGALVHLLDPDVVLHADMRVGGAPVSRTVRGAAAVAEQALGFARRARYARLARVNGATGLVAAAGPDRPIAVLGFTVAGGRIAEIDILADPVRLARLDPAVFTAGSSRA
jgi:RNA polymerase sigma-70 factor (ECF subfamily)